MADALFDRLEAATNCSSLLKKHLTKPIFEKLKDKRTGFGGTLVECINSGVENLDSGVGIYACDSEAYSVFSDVFDPIIREYHGVKEDVPIKHPECNFGDTNFENLDPNGELILSTRIRVGRSHANYGFPPLLTKEMRNEMEKKTIEAFADLPDELQGKYHPLTGMSDATKQQLTDDHFLFNDKDRFLRAAGGYNDWAIGRGIYFNEKKDFLVWVNEEDHLRIISMQQGGDLGAVYTRLVKGIQSLQQKLQFARDGRLGFLTFCPSNLGTTLRASVHVRIPNLSSRSDFKNICDEHHLQARGIHGEHTESAGGVYDISNKRRLGLTEIKAVQEMYDGVKKIIEMEKRFASGK